VVEQKEVDGEEDTAVVVMVFDHDDAANSVMKMTRNASNAPQDANDASSGMLAQECWPGERSGDQEFGCFFMVNMYGGYLQDRPATEKNKIRFHD
jgi:hypothetical protein